MTRLVGALAYAALGAAALSGCGGEDVPPGGVAKVGDTVIERSEFDKRMRTAAAAQSQNGRSAAVDPPGFERCVAAKRQQSQTRGSKPDAAELKRRCEREYEQLKGTVMAFLVQSEWVRQEAEARGVEVSQAEVKRAFERQRKQAFPETEAYRRYLESSGTTEEELVDRVRFDLLREKLTGKMADGAANEEISDAEIREHYEKNRERYAQPESRDLRVVVTEGREDAEKAKSALESGQGFESVADRFSIDEATKRQGGKLAVVRGQQEGALDSAVFAAEEGEVEGPVKTRAGYYVFEVTNVSPASEPSLEQAEASVRGALRSQRRRSTLEDFAKEFREKYREQTTCAEGYEIPECENGPEERTSGSGSSDEES